MRIVTLIRRVFNARRYGVLFVRTRWFRLPRKIRVNKTWLTPTYPNEHGVLTDFRVCFVYDDYGLGSCPVEPARIVDIGANIGWFALAARGRYPQATLHCYEPNPRVLTFLRSNTKSGGCVIFPEAVGSESGYVRIVDAGDSNQATTEESGQGVPQVGLDTVVERIGHIDLLKMDCEGAEWRIFQAGESWRKVRELRMEYHLTGGHTVTDVRAAVEGLGFTITRLTEGDGWGAVWATNRQFETSLNQPAPSKEKLAS